MAQQTLFEGHFHAAEDQLAALHKAVYIVTMTNAHICSFFLFRAGQIFPRGDLQVGVVALRQLHRAAGQLKQAAIVGDEAGLFFVQLVQRGEVSGPVEALGRLHRIQGAAVGRFGDAAAFRHGLAVAPLCRFDGILHRHRRGRSPAQGGGVQCGFDDRLAHKGAGRIVDGHDLAAGCQHAVLRALGAGRPAGHDLHRLLARGRLLLQKLPVFARHQHDLIHEGAFGKGADAPLHHRLSAQIKAELVEPHPGGGTCGHQNRRHTFFHF